jgi:antitoxin HicB
MMNKNPKRTSLEYYLDLSYPIQIYTEVSGGYTLTIKDLPGCVSQGEQKKKLWQ